MQGIEYILLHVQEPILYVVRKQHRHTPTQGNTHHIFHRWSAIQNDVWSLLFQNRHFAQCTFLWAFSVTPLADYYIIGGAVYQAPDLGSVLNSRLVSTVCFVNFMCNLYSAQTAAFHEETHKFFNLGKIILRFNFF